MVANWFPVPFSFDFFFPFPIFVHFSSFFSFSSRHPPHSWLRRRLTQHRIPYTISLLRVLFSPFGHAWPCGVVGISRCHILLLWRLRNKSLRVFVACQYTVKFVRFMKGSV
ncbi:hypothetical protein B0J18DRAFT_155919 [Chaetomium sp. MPI-SDFR-AT-0129]|nr:hypothetical protein B0J18DRAFT_155919 [Chaetomium sp. MPI-SDFR-AT-0129]